jgi:hypothetical protein
MGYDRKSIFPNGRGFALGVGIEQDRQLPGTVLDWLPGSVREQSLITDEVRDIRRLGVGILPKNEQYEHHGYESEESFHCFLFKLEKKSDRESNALTAKKS